MRLLQTSIQILISAVLAAALVFWGIELGSQSGLQSDMESGSESETLQDVSLDNDNSVALQAGMMMQDFEESLVSMIGAVSPSVVNVIANQDFEYYQRGLYGVQPRVGTRQLGGGSGFLVSRDGYIITNRHVVDDSRLRYSVVYEDGSVTEIDEIWLDPSLDIAVLKVAANTLPLDAQSVPVIDIEKQVALGQFAFAIGNTLAEFQNSVTFGIISGRNRTIDIGLRNRYAGLYQTDTSISQGNSGGPLFNTQGEVIGINTAVSALGENIGFAIPVTQQFIDATLNSIQQYGEIRRPFIGISYVDLDPMTAQEYEIDHTQGVLIQEVVPGSAASASGLQAGDVIVQMDSQEINDEYPLQYLLFTKLPNETLDLVVYRNAQEVKVSLRLGEQE